MKQGAMKMNSYTSEQRDTMLRVVSNTNRAFLSPDDIRNFTKEFNEKFRQNRTPKAMATQFRDLKTAYKLPVKIAFVGISEPFHSHPEPVEQEKKGKKMGLNIPAILKELGLMFSDLVRQNTEMKRELQRLAAVRSAIDKYRNGGK